MRFAALVLSAAVLLTACGKDDPAQNRATTDQGLTADDIVSNDTTAIDAATNDAANMAEDVNYTINETENGSEDGNESGNAD